VSLDRYSGAPFDRLFNADESRALDRFAIERHGIAGIVLMKRAGEAAWRSLRRRWPNARTITVVCGRGNNAGDGYIVAGSALLHGVAVQLIQLGPADALRGDAARARDWALGCGLAIGEVDDDAPNFDIAGEVVVDALLGTGVTGDVRPGFARAIATIAGAGAPVLAIDIPSGLCADTGRVLGSAVRADATVTFIGMKRGLATGAGADYTGAIELATLGVPADCYATVGAAAIEALQWSNQRQSLPQRTATAYKHQSGHVLVVGGDSGMGGAVAMAAEAALKVGAGLVSVATRPEHVAAILARRPEIMAKGVTSPDAIDALLARASVVALGPGLGREAWGQALFDRVAAAEKPCVIDADGLHRLAARPGATRSAALVVTPHVAEAAALLGTTVNEVQRDRFAAAAALVSRYAGGAPFAAVLKGAGSIVASSAAPAGVCLHGNPAMASAGMGDVLTGIVAGILAQGVEVAAATRAGVCLHSFAADRVAARDGQRGLVATDLVDELRAILNER
jgi:hydroxyethylthiazole kinase-like uncharacterized protein yjeF